jgi:hypothetical protein
MFRRPIVRTILRVRARVGESAPLSAQINQVVSISLVAVGIATAVVPLNIGAGVRQVHITITL